MAKPTLPSRGTSTQMVSGNAALNAALASSSSVYHPRMKANPATDRQVIARPWQIEAYRQVNICGEARYAATLFGAIAGRAEIGVSKAQTRATKASWVDAGPEVEIFAELVPTVRDRSKLIRDYMIHRVIAGECYLIARDRVRTDPGYIAPPDPDMTWLEYLASQDIDVLDPDFDLRQTEDPNKPIWEIVAVTELRKVGEVWEVRHDNLNWLKLHPDDPVIRMWTPDPQDRREAWSPFRSLLSTLQEIEWSTKHIFTQIRSRLVSAGVWFLPNNLTFAPPPSDSVEGGQETIASMNEAELFGTSLAAAGMEALGAEEVALPTIVMADPAALANIDQKKLIQFWSQIDDKAMLLRSDAVRRFALGMDLPPEQVLGSSGLAVSGSSGSAGSVNHWGVWANEEQTISGHIEPALDDLVSALTTSVLHTAYPGTEYVIGYDTATLRLRQDRSKESIELYDRGVLKPEVMLRENGFDPTLDKMTNDEFKRWLLTKIASGSATPEQVQESLRLLGVVLNISLDGDGEEAPAQPGRNNAPSLKDHPYEGPPRVQHDHSEAPFSALHASCEGLVLRALEKTGNRLINAGKRGKDRDKTTPPHAAHLVFGVSERPAFDFTLASTVLEGLTAQEQTRVENLLDSYCQGLYDGAEPYNRKSLIKALEAL